MALGWRAAELVLFCGAANGCGQMITLLADIRAGRSDMSPRLPRLLAVACGIAAVGELCLYLR